MESCELCPLHKSAITTNCMKGVGPDGAEIMLVGQGPGGYEDMAGVPFIGDSGVFLDGMLADAGIDRAAAFVTNATRCRPPLINKKERAPTPDEINTCRRYLIEEVQRVRPQAIIALGDAALRALCKTSGVKAKRGQQFELHPEFEYECPVFVTYHPAAVLRTQPLRRTVVSDLRRVRDRGIEPEKVRWEWMPKEAGSPVILAPGAIAYDIETYDEKGEITDAPTQIAVAQYVDGEPIATVALWNPIIGKAWPKSLTISHFGWDFDDAKTDIESDRDTAALAYLEDETQPLGLESLCVKYLGVRGWKESREGATLGSDALGEYNARDSVNTLLLHDCLVPILGPRIKIADLILRPARLALNECTKRGILIDGEQVHKSRLVFAADIREARARCVELAGHGEDFNPGSNAQVGDHLLSLGFELPSTPSGEPQVDKATLSELFDPFANAVLDYRHAVKYDSTYGKPYTEAALREDGRFHPLYTIIRTLTGRTSSKKHPEYNPATGNVQNLPRDLRYYFDEVAIADYASVEFRLAAWVAREQTILRHFMQDPSWDPHRWFGALFYNKNEAQVTKDGPNSERQVSKSANFSQLFLGTPETLVEYGKKMGVVISYDTAAKAHFAFRNVAYPGFIPWWNRVLDEIKTKGYVESATGRRRHFGDFSLMKYEAKQDAWREAVNFLVQSLAADIALLGLASCRAEGMPINGFFHDAISFDLAGGWTPDAEAIRRCMVDTPLSILRREFNVNINVPLGIEIKIQRKEKALV